MKRLFVLMSCAVLLSACATRTKMPAWKPVAKTAAPAQYDAQGNAVPKVRVGVSSVTVERLASAEGCTGGQGASLTGEPGPVEMYRMVCGSGQVFVAKCEFRQCKPVALPPSGGYAMRPPAPVAAAPVALPAPQPAAVVTTSPVAGAQAAPVAAMPAPASAMAEAAGAPAEQGALVAPKLIVKWECGSCKPNEIIADHLRVAYEKAAAQAGYTISETEVATMTITRINARSGAARVAFANLFGTDVLHTQTSMGGKTITVNEQGKNWGGINPLVNHVGMRTFREWTGRN